MISLRRLIGSSRRGVEPRQSPETWGGFEESLAIKDLSKLPLREFVPATLAAAAVGIWFRDMATSQVFYCPVAAGLLALPAESCETGIDIERFAGTIHAEDRTRFRRALSGDPDLPEMDSAPYRTSAEGGLARSLFGRARFERDGDGTVVRARGILLDVTRGTAGTRDGEAAAHALDLREEVETIDRAGLLALETRRLIDALGTAETERLRMVADGLLIEIGRYIAAMLDEPQRYDA